MEEHISEERGPRRRYRSLFWPVVLIGVGAIWLLATAGLISGASFAVLARLWPLILIVIGLDILVGRRSPALGAVIGLGAIVLVLGLMVAAPTMGWARENPVYFFGEPVYFNVGPVEVKTASVSEPLGNTTSADVTLELSFWDANVRALPRSSNNLIEADIYYSGDLVFEVEGNREKSVVLGYEYNQVGVSIPSDSGSDQWEIGLSPDVPVDLTVKASMGNSMLDLSGLQLSGLTVEGSFGNADIYLPETDDPYEVDLDLSSGNFTVNVPDGANVEIDAEGSFGNLTVNIGRDATVKVTGNMSSGNFTFNVGKDAQVDLEIAEMSFGNLIVNTPSNAGVRLDVQGSSFGDVQVPPDYHKVSSGENEKEGVWESPDYGSSGSTINITINDMSAGNLIVNQ